MNSIVYVGMDVHKDSFSLCAYTFEADKIQFEQKVAGDYRLVLKYLGQLKLRFPHYDEIICGYEAGCLGYSLYHDLTNQGVNCIIMAPTTMARTNSNKVKTDRKDAASIARSLAFGLYSQVYVPTDEDNEIKEFIRMRDDKKKMLKSTKQQILSFLLRHGLRFNGTKSNWTIAHLKWMKSLDLVGVLQEAFNEYLISYEYLTDKIQRLDRRIEELASQDTYVEKVGKLSCLIGVKSHTALSMVVEVGDFKRFESADKFAAFLGLIPGEVSSGETQRGTGITKTGNRHLRRLLVESAQSYSRGAIGHKSKVLKKRQEGKPPELIAYADRANERLRRKFYRMTLHKGKNRNVAVTSVARELACFMWGMMTDNIA